MKSILTEKFLRKLGSWAFIIVGIGHIAAHLAAPNTPQRNEIVGAMRGFVIDMPGRTGTLYEYHQGFSLMMGILLAAYGIRTLLALRAKHLAPADELPSLLFDTLVSGIAVGVSAQLFFAVPMVLTAVALVSFSAALAMVWREARWQGQKI